MKNLIALFFLLLGVFGGLYVGCYEFFIKGIVLTIETLKATPINSLALAWGIFKIMSAAFFGWLTFAVGFLIAQIVEEVF